MPTMRGMSVLADPPAGRPDVAVVRQPIADELAVQVKRHRDKRRRRREARAAAAAAPPPPAA